MQIRLIVMSIVILTLVSCEKKELTEPEEQPTTTTPLTQGLPPAPQFINGYMYTSYKLIKLGSNYGSSQIASAYFGEPARNLMKNFEHARDQQTFSSNNKNAPNVTVNRVTVNGIGLGGTGTTSYLSSATMDTVFFDTKPHWEVEGNKTFKQSTFDLRYPPALLNTSYNFSLQVSAGYTLGLAPLLANYDSAAVYIYYGSAFPPIYKSCSSAANEIVISSRDLANLKNRSTCNIILMAFNYSHQTVADKLYVFETGSKLERILTIKQ